MRKELKLFEIMPQSPKVLFCSSLPLTQFSFEAEMQRPQKDFIRHYVESRKEKQASYTWRDYYKELVRPYTLLKSGYQRQLINGITYILQ